MVTQCQGKGGKNEKKSCYYRYFFSSKHRKPWKMINNVGSTDWVAVLPIFFLSLDEHPHEAGARPTLIEIFGLIFSRARAAGPRLSCQKRCDDSYPCWWWWHFSFSMGSHRPSRNFPTRACKPSARINFTLFILTSKLWMKWNAFREFSCITKGIFMTFRVWRWPPRDHRHIH